MKIKVGIYVVFIIAIVGFGIHGFYNSLNKDKNNPGVQSEINVNVTNDISTYLSGVGLIRCWQDHEEGLPEVPDLEASGSLWKFGDNHVVLTNKHAILDKPDLCLLIIEGSDTFKLVSTYQSEIKEGIDAAAMQILVYDKVFGGEDKRSGLNYKISTMPVCPQKMNIGKSVRIVGYPSFSKIDGPGILNDQKPVTVTDGIISSYYTNVMNEVPDYFVSAKVDSGSSGGVAFSTFDNGLCLLGIPTWLNTGDYETQGIVQNIYNVINR